MENNSFRAVATPASSASNSSVSEPLAVDPLEAARLLGVSPRTLWTLYTSGRLHHLRVGRRVLIPVESIKAFLAGKEGAR